MKRFFAEVVLLGGLLACTACAPGNTYFQHGIKAEYRKDWDTALVNYEKAAQSDPANVEYQLRERHARSQASMFHTERGRELLREQRTAEAIGEFQKAASIDPSNQTAKQELSRLLTKEVAAKKSREERLQEAIKANENQAPSGAPQLKPLPQEPLTHFRISADSKRVYETLCKLAGLNVAFSSDFQAQPVSLDLNDVTIANALHILALQTHSFWRVVTPNTILVVPDNPANRRDYQTEVLKTVYLDNSLKPADMTAITTALKQLLGLQRVIDNPSANAIIIRDTPEHVQEAVNLIHDLDHGKAEIMIDITVLEADADRVRELGLTPATVTPSGSITNGLQGAALFNPQSNATLAHLSTNDFSVVVPSAVATAILNDSRTRILQNPEVRVTDGDTATLRIGSRVPYATGSFLPSLGVGTTGQTGQFGGLIASTQFQFQDVGVNVDLTPHLMPNGDIAIHAKIEISSVGAPVTIAGVNEPTFGQRQIEHDIRLEEGETSLLGGLLQTTDTTTVTGVPGLGEIPGLKYLFSDTKHERVQTDVLIMLTPRVVRLPESYVETAAEKSPAQPVTKTSTPPAAKPASPVPQAEPTPAPPSAGGPPSQR
ncbi:MAG TPA: secretin N-terminal domain-containing protein [Terriglobia bacterium]|nr:secretin N-terminal domain-containing protein [Terriglobia bacterium]